MKENEETKPLLSGRSDRVIEDNDEDVILTGCGATAACDPRQSLHRFLILILICFLSFGSYFCYDNPAALQSQIKSAMNVNSSQYMLLYSLYSWPNVILCFFGGFLLDRVFGIRFGTIVFGIFVLIGQCIFAVGASINSYVVMEIGRFVFGLGGENLAVAQNTYAVSWFKNKELNMVFGLQLSFSRVGSTVNMNVMKPIYDATSEALPDYKRLAIALWVGAGFCILSMICGLMLWYYDARAARITKKGLGETGEVIKLSDVKDFPLTLWLIFLVCVMYYVAVFPFIGLGTVFFQDKFDFNPTEANLVNSLVYFISAGASPVFGFAVDKTGRNIFWVVSGVVLTIAAHFMLAFTFINPFVTMSLMGIAYSLLACALWPIVAYIMPEHQLGTAYGFMQSIQNLGLAIVPMVAGQILDEKGYLILEVFFSVLLCVALIGSLCLYLVDLSEGGFLNMSAKEREFHKKSIAKREVEKQNDPHLLKSPLQARSAFALRNRYLSRIGAKLPDHFNPHVKALSRHGVLQ
ncbi:major facilitator superfamily domain-containing protein 1-like [Anneissia japonica]|uniref:major facilitator superfamily domain-containing protein 1-like n=1 Tax=Anneissia japonica TaxID=1529436 RepID=UPI0014256688|nr:major facilitator superfamily domain-containing protein 1-like [Anneissia japonica]